MNTVTRRTTHYTELRAAIGQSPDRQSNLRRRHETCGAFVPNVRFVSRAALGIVVDGDTNSKLKQINYELKEGALQCFSQTHTHLPEEDSLHPLLVLNKLVSRLRAGTSVGSPEISGANACRASQLAPTASFTLTSASVATTGPEARAIGHLG